MDFHCVKANNNTSKCFDHDRHFFEFVTWGLNLHFLKLKFTARTIYGTQLIQNNVGVKLKLNCKFKMYETRFNFKLEFHHVHVDCFEHKDLSAHISSHYLLLWQTWLWRKHWTSEQDIQIDNTGNFTTYTHFWKAKGAIFFLSTLLHLNRNNSVVCVNVNSRTTWKLHRANCYWKAHNVHFKHSQLLVWS